MSNVLFAGCIVLSILTIDTVLCFSVDQRARVYGSGWRLANGLQDYRAAGGVRTTPYDLVYASTVDVVTVNYRPFSCPSVQVNQERVLSPFRRNTRDFFGCKECDEMGVPFPSLQASSDGMLGCIAVASNMPFILFHLQFTSTLLTSNISYHTYFSLFACLYASIL